MRTPTNTPATTIEFDALFDCFVINLKRQPERLQTFHEQNNSSAITFNYFEATDGMQLRAADIYGSVVASDAINYTKGMIGNAMSHLALWRRCAQQAKYFVVFEDDAVVRRDIKGQLCKLVSGVPYWDIILLGYNTDVPLEFNVSPGIDYGGMFSARYPTVEQISAFVKSSHPLGLFRLTMAMGCCGYAVAPKGAQFLIRSCFPMDNRSVGFRTTNAIWPAASLDGMMGSVYKKIFAFACFGPLVMTPNNRKTSSTVSTPY